MQHVTQSGHIQLYLTTSVTHSFTHSVTHSLTIGKVLITHKNIFESLSLFFLLSKIVSYNGSPDIRNVGYISALNFCLFPLHHCINLPCLSVFLPSYVQNHQAFNNNTTTYFTRTVTVVVNIYHYLHISCSLPELLWH